MAHSTDKESPYTKLYPASADGIGKVYMGREISQVLGHLGAGWLAAMLALLPLLGWAGWRGDAGVFGFLFYAGYGVLFMIAGRDNNFYWALMVTPAWFVGLVFVPRAVRSLWASARGH